MTNFEKWRDSLTAEMFANIQVIDRDAFLEWANAEYKETRFDKLLERIWQLLRENPAYLWANAEAKEDENGDQL